MTKNLPIGRTISCLIAGILVITGVFFLGWSFVHRQAFHRWVDAKPVDIPIDLSQPGEFRGNFHQTCQTSHGEAVCIVVPSSVLETTSPTNLFANLRLECRIEDSDGKEVVRSDFPGDLLWDDRLIDGAIPVAYFAPFQKGDFTITLRVTQGVAALTDVPQRLIARYLLCGLEMLPSLIAMVIGIVSLVVSGIILLVVLVVTKRKRRDQATTTSTLSSDAAPSAPPPER